MLLFRNAYKKDFNSILDLSIKSGIGLTTLPKDANLLNQRLNKSITSFQKQVNLPKNEYYLFVAEDINTNTIAGTSAIEAYTGSDTPFYSYKLATKKHLCPSLKIENILQFLKPVHENEGKTELCTLFLDPNYRKGSNALLLSRSRFLFMANFRERFCQKVIAELRGISDELGHSPFWEHVGKHFFKMSFDEADRLTMLTNKQFIADLLPNIPICIDLLPENIKAIIGNPHPTSAKAMHILQKEGFKLGKHVDIFDAGPTIEASLKKIKTLAKSKVAKIKSISQEQIHSDRYLLANTSLDFRAIINHLDIQDDVCTLHKDLVELLQVKKNDYLRYLIFN